MTRQAEHNAKRYAEGYRKRQFLLTPETLVALCELRARGAVSDAAAVNAAVAALAEAYADGRAFLGRINAEQVR